MSPDEAAIVGALAGALVGVFGTGFLMRQQHRRAAKASARLLLAELVAAWRSIAFVLDESDWSALASHPPELPSWERVAHGLAGSSRPVAWHKLANAQRAIEMIGSIARGIDSPRRIYPDADPAAPGDADRTELREAKREIEEAILALERTAESRDEADAVRLDRDVQGTIDAEHRNRHNVPAALGSEFLRAIAGEIAPLATHW